MDPVSAFGLAVNVLAVVDFSKTFLETLGQIKDSGSSAATQDIVSISRSLQASNAKITLHSLVEGDDKVFKDLVEECQSLSEELIRLADELSVTSSSALVTRVKVTARTMWSRSKIEARKTRLEAIRAQLLFDIVVPIAGRVNTIPDKAAIDTQTRVLLSEIREGANASDAMEKRLRAFHEEYAAVQDKRHVEIVSLLHEIRDVKPRLGTFPMRDSDRKTRDLVLNDLLASLYFRQEYDRFHDINSAHKGTFEWIFRDSPSAADKATWSNFDDWLRHHAGIYWISGKAGSGKSTLMKLLGTDERSRAALLKWSVGSRLLILSFYFWSPATVIARQCNSSHERLPP
ncbi:hypothetical protein K4K49_010886 [Colletotrichum sp. SAR 10_70]|nr:hypothetical protein K4K50_012238 [Colletotrichum sp. SAR 10_71]KAI8202459.1 hypothetical protein K4K49_010886 [Colletotrichum sp. SAR 10_70]